MPARTSNYGLYRPEFDDRFWHTLMNKNSSVIDALLASIVGTLGVVGVWENSTAYTVGQTVVDEDAGSLFECAVGHTSAATPTTFSADRTANPTYWTNVSISMHWRGDWAEGTAYEAGDIVVTDSTSGIAYIANQAHTASAAFATDATYWDTLIDISAAVTAATDAQTAAENARDAALAAVGSVKVTSSDTTAGVLNTKLTAGANISLAVGSPGGNETLAVAATGVVTTSQHGENLRTALGLL